MSSKRGRRGAKVLDLSDWEKLFKDRRSWTVLARVEAHDGEATHCEFVNNDDGTKAVFVDVVSMPSNIEMSCRLSQDGGLWRIPPIGTEVIVSIPDGQIDWTPTIVAISGKQPDGLSPTAAILVVDPGMTVLVHDGTAADAKKLPTWADFNALRDWVEAQFAATGGHTHVVSGAVTTTIAAVAAPAPSVPTVAVPTPTGTSVLKAK